MKGRGRARADLNGSIEAELDELSLLQLATKREADRYRTMFESAPVAFIATDAFGKILEANTAASELLAIDPRFLAGKPLPTYVTADERGRFRRWIIDLYRGRVSDAFAARMIRRSGVTFEAHISATPADGEIWWAIVDATAGEQAEERTWALNRHLDAIVASQVGELQALYDELPVGIAIVDAATRRVHSRNRRALEILRPWGGALPGLEPSECDGPIVRNQLIDRALAGEPAEREVNTVPAPGGGAVVLALSATPLREADGTVVAAALTFDDLSERERRELADAQFVDNAAHQLRSPITAIAAATAALVAGAKDDPEERERFITHIERESTRMGRLVDALLALARLQRGAARPPLSLIPVRPLFENILADRRAHPGVDIVVHCRDDVAFLGDEGMSREAIANVVDNALSYTQAGAIRLTARRDGESTVIEVADTGPGIEPSVRERVFERFFQAGPKDGHKGSGLGLAIAAEATRGSGGTLELLNSSPGTTLRFTFLGAKLL